MRQILKKYPFIKDQGIYYLEIDNILYSIGVLKLGSNSKLLISNNLWEVSNSSYLFKFLSFFYKRKTLFIPESFMKLQKENINLVRILAIKGRNVEISIECEGRKELLRNGEVINGVHIVNISELNGFLNEYNFEDQLKEFKLSFK